MSTTTLDHPEDDPNDCPDCVAAGGICAYHVGWADGWDTASAVVGRLVLEQRGGGR